MFYVFTVRVRMSGANVDVSFALMNTERISRTIWER